MKHLHKHSFPIVLIALVLSLASCAPAAPQVETTAAPLEQQVDLSGIHAYLMEKLEALSMASVDQQTAANAYYELAKDQNFNYASLWAVAPQETTAQLETARNAWLLASPLYEQIEGIVAGVPSLSTFDVILDAGGSGAEDPENAVPFDLTLPDGRVLPSPGNLYGVLETTLWGTNPAYAVPALQPDLNGNGVADFGEVLPDANVLKGAADLFDRYVKELVAAADAWQPNTSDAFTALVVMVPTMNEYFESWKNSRFVAGEASTQMDFAVISRLSDIQDILSSLQIVYSGVEPLVATLGGDQAARIAADLDGLKQFVATIAAQEKDGKHFTAEEADQLGAEAQNRATAITGQISQVAASLNVSIEE